MPGIGGGGAVPDTGGQNLDNLTETSNSVSYFGLKQIDKVISRPLKSVYSFSGTVASPGIAVSSLVTLDDKTRFVIIQPFSTAITISLSVTSFGGLQINGDQRFTLPMSPKQLNNLYIGVASTATRVVVEAFDYEY